jgi:gamma-glutamylcyclotransferase (GGCT)/AIG2-like uncharacterized protein YtfP
MKEYLFTYGTLSPEFAPLEIAEAVGRLKFVNDGFIRGWLYDLGDFPGAVLDEKSPNYVFGQVFQLPDDKLVLNQLDEYEEFDLNNIKGSLFVRKKATVTTANQRKIECWIYVYNQIPEQAELVASGNYTEYKTV